jgi:hypothetical protein
MIDDRTGLASEPHPHAAHYTWTADSNRFGWTSLLGAFPGGHDVSTYELRMSGGLGLPATQLF